MRSTPVSDISLSNVALFFFFFFFFFFVTVNLA